jgi:hypothetical protein
MIIFPHVVAGGYGYILEWLDAQDVSRGADQHFCRKWVEGRPGP